MNDPKITKVQPPKWAVRFLYSICPTHLVEEIEGDLLQKFHRDVKWYGKSKAKRRFVWNVIRFFRPGIVLRNKFSIALNQVPMFRNYFKTTYRHILKSKVNFSFKLGGLTLGLFSLLVIAIYLSYQWSFDRFHDDYENVYRVNSNRDEDGKQVSYAMVPAAIGPALKEEFPEVNFFTRTNLTGVVVKYNNNFSRFYGLMEADSSIFDVFSFKFIRGNRNALHRQNSIVLTQSLAKEIFGDEDPINKVLTCPDYTNRTLEVMAIIEDFPSNSHLILRGITNFGALDQANMNSWQVSWDGSVNLYVRLSTDVNPDDFEQKVKPWIKKNIAKSDDGSERNFRIFLQPLSDIYLDQTFKLEFGKKGSSLYVYIFFLLGFLLLIIACINYVNLSIADFDTRTKEMGIRKVMGARKMQISFQVAVEAVLICTIALLIAMGFLYFLFPQVAGLLDSDLRFEMFRNKEVILLVILIILLLTTFSTAYPSYQLVSQSPIQDLKRNQGIGKNLSIGKTLLLTQFTISIVCICATLIVGRQVRFLSEKNIGYDRSNLVSLIMPREYPVDKIPVLKNELARLAGVEAVSYSYYLMAGTSYFKDWYEVEQKGKMSRVLLNEMFVDHDFLQTMNIRLLAGRNFDVNNSTDKHSAFIVNETAAKEFGWESAIGKAIKLGYVDENGPQEGTVVGVVKDFNTLSLHEKIEPVVLRLQYDSWPGNCLNVKVKGSLSELIPVLKSTFEKLMGGFSADLRIVETDYNNQYRKETKAFASLQFGTLVIILISALGIFSLSLYMSVRRMKEFGIRKVLGATDHQIATLHIGFFVRIVLLANILALPAAYWLMTEWLNDFAYKTKLNGLVFLLVMCISFLLVIISGGYSAWKAGRMNPVDVIKIQ